MPRRIFVGDIQGCRDELERLLERVRFDPAADVLHPVGDLVNRGPDSVGALRLCRSLAARAVLGNHDLHLLGRHAGLRGPKRRDTLDDVLAAADRDELCGWLAGQPFVRRMDDLYQIHAGLHPGWSDPQAELHGLAPLGDDPRAAFAVRVRYCDEHGALPDDDGAPPGPPFRPWFEHYDPARHAGRTVVFGHWAVRGLVVEERLRGLDTGCVWGGRLTAWIPEEDRIEQVDAARAYAEVR
ncbi:MAG: metallophosphoesterase [Planctomycetota bacterium]